MSLKLLKTDGSTTAGEALLIKKKKSYMDSSPQTGFKSFQQKDESMQIYSESTKLARLKVESSHENRK